ncbi:hypothetical protein [Streptomyces sp. NPDC058653]|uniref:hypothetical protein n=1 Tax=Streptomyces sp. NPDC058653 TaxID=3346576 RepID=UPI003669AF98
MPAPTLALVEEARGEGLAVRVAEIASTPGHPSTGSAWMYRVMARMAFEAAAENAVQPETGWGQ